MFTSALTTLLALAATSTASSIPRQVRGEFHLRTIVKANDFPVSINDLAIGHVTASETTANLVVLPRDFSTGSTFFEAGGQAITACGYTGLPGTGVINPGIKITPGGTATVPSLNKVQLNKEEFTPMIVYQGGRLEYRRGGWMACPLSVLEPGNQNETVVISYRMETQRVLQGCANIDIKVVQAEKECMID